MFEHLPENDQDLNSHETGFVEHYLKCRSVKESAEYVGRSAGWGSKTINKPHIKEMIREHEKDSLNRAGITNEWLMLEMKDIAMLAKQEGSYSAAISGIKTLMEIQGMLDKDNREDGTTYNIMGSVIIAPDEKSAQRLLDNPNGDIEGDYKVLNFDIGDDA